MSQGLTFLRGERVRRFSPRIGVRGRPSIARVSVLSVKDIRVAGTGDCGMRRPLPTQAGDEPLASRSLRPRYIFLPPRGLKFFEWRYQRGALVRGFSPRIGVRGRPSITRMTKGAAGTTRAENGGIYRHTRKLHNPVFVPSLTRLVSLSLNSYRYGFMLISWFVF